MCNIWYSRCSQPEVFCKKGVLKYFAKFTWKRLCQSLFFNKVLFLIKTLAQVFSGEFCEISKNIFSYRTPPIAASGIPWFYLSGTSLYYSRSKSEILWRAVKSWSIKKLFLKISQYSQEKRPEGLQLYFKKVPIKVLSCEYCKSFKNIYFEEHLRMAAFKICSFKLYLLPPHYEHSTINNGTLTDTLIVLINRYRISI